MLGELRIELRGGEHAPGMLVVLPPGIEPPTSLPQGAAVVCVTANGPELLRTGEPNDAVGTTRWTNAGIWRVRVHVSEDPSSVVDLTSWGSPELRVLRGPDGAPGRSKRLPREEEGELAIGRSPECDIVLEDNSVSRRHARVVRRDRKYYLEDLWSKGGTFLGDEKIGEARLLRHQDRIRVGKSLLEFYSLLDALVEEEKSVAPAAPAAALPAEQPKAKAAETGRAQPKAGAIERDTEVEREQTAQAARRKKLSWENGVLALLALAALGTIGYLVSLVLG